MRRLTIVLLFNFVLLAMVTVTFAQKVTTVAGGFVGDGGAATQASFQFPTGLTKDAKGNTYVTDPGEQRIRKISSRGVISTFAGTGIVGFSGDGGQARSAQVNSPNVITTDSAGDIVFSDNGNNRIRKIDLTGIITTIAGNGIAGYTGDGGPATSASLNGPVGVAYDSAGNLYISDRNNNVIRVVNGATGIINTFAGNGTAGYCGDGGPPTAACLNAPKGLALDKAGDLFIADAANHRVREVTGGMIKTVAGNGTGGFSGDGGQATSASIGTPRAVAVNSGILYISNAGSARVRNVVLSTGIINTSMGSTPGYDGDGHPPLSSQFFSNGSLVVASSTNIEVVDIGNARVRQLSGGLLKTVAGGFIGDGKAATSAALVLPQAVVFDNAGNLFITEFSGNRIRKMDTTGKISTVAGVETGVSGYSGDGGPATSAQLYFPQSAIFDSAGNMFIADQGNNVIRRVDAVTQTITTFSNSPNFGGGLGWMAFDPSGSLYVGDAGACVVWKLDSSGNATAVAGVSFNCGYNGDNIPATTALLNLPWAITFDSSGNLYISDSGNYRVRRVNTGGTITTFAGNGTACSSGTSACGDGGKARSAQLNSPLGLAFSKGSLYITDEGDSRIRKVTAGIITTSAGTGVVGYNGNGLPALSTNLDDPIDVAINPVNGALYEVDDVQSRVRKVQ